jgi:hypothetical protein
LVEGLGFSVGHVTTVRDEWSAHHRSRLYFLSSDRGYVSRREGNFDASEGEFFAQWVVRISFPH